MDTTLNRFRNSLDAGEFQLLIETSSPSFNNELFSAGERLAELEKAVNAIKSVNTALAITDRYNNLESYRALEFAKALSPETRDRHVVYLSGRDTGVEQALELASAAVKEHIVNLIPASGNASVNDTARGCRKRLFTESIEIIRALRRDFGEEFFLGSTVNPFEYTSLSLMGQYFKLIKKFNCGAGFAVTQAGWDMLKLQSLRWYLSWRNLFYPTIARLVLLTPNMVENILRGDYPGLYISPDFQRILEKELCYSLNQFEAAQLRRLELQVAGCRLLGFSGVQLYGADTPQRATTAANRIANALREFTDFDSWLQEYNSYLAQAEMAPSSDSFFLYDRRLSRECGVGAIPHANDLGEIDPNWMEKLRYRRNRFFFHNSSKHRADSQKLLKKLMASCGSCRNCRLDQTFFVCPESCPKHLANGPCGGVRPDGRCEVGNFECVHSRILRLAIWRNRLSDADTLIIDSGK